MKLLFDQNISFRIVRQLDNILPQSSQVRLLGLENADDIEIWEYAKTHDFVVVTFDTDFYDLSLIKGVPPKIIWLRLGNVTTKQIATCVIANLELIKEFIINEDYKELACLEIDK
jgi:predicted nuclease of predicted toxin-antitoxin system